MRCYDPRSWRHRVWSYAAALTIHSSRHRFAARLNSGVRPRMNSRTGVLLVALALLALCGCSGPSDKTCQVDPQIFCPVYERWEAEISADTRTALIAMDPERIPSLSWQFEAGVRHRFGLWQNNDVTVFFRTHGIDHPELMSVPLTSGFIGYLRGQRVDMAKIARQHAQPPTPPPPSASTSDRISGTLGPRPNNSFNPMPLRGTG